MAKRESRIDTGKIDTLIGKDTTINGTVIINKGVLKIEGKVEGEIRSEGNVIIGETATLKANITADNVLMGGELHGNIETKGRLEIIPPGKLYGDIKAGALDISEGALFVGTSEMRIPQEQRPIRPISKNTDKKQ